MTVIAGFAHYTIIQAISGTISACASSTIIYVIFHTRRRLSSVYNRLLLGLSVSDIVFSTCMALNTLPVVRDTPNVTRTPGFGNQTTCNIQGFLIVMFAQMGPFYNCMLNIYFFCLIKLQLSQGVIQKNIEPYMHSIPMLYSLVIAITALCKKYINPKDSVCFLNTVPENCATEPDVECERGDEHISAFIFFGIGPSLYLCIVTIMVSMTTIFRTIRREETHSRHHQEQGSPGLSNLRNRDHNEGNRHSRLSLRRPVSNSRKLMHQAIGYIGAYLLSFTFSAINEVTKATTGNYDARLSILVNIFYPLQGLFNFIVFIYPKVTKQLRDNLEYSIWDGCKAAIQCKERSARQPGNTNGLNHGAAHALQAAAAPSQGIVTRSSSIHTSSSMFRSSSRLSSLNSMIQNFQFWKRQHSQIEEQRSDANRTTVGTGRDDIESHAVSEAVTCSTLSNDEQKPLAKMNEIGTTTQEKVLDKTFDSIPKEEEG